MTKEQLINKLNDCFDIGDPYVYQLTRVKTAFQVGTMTIDDFEEIGNEFIEELADFILKEVK